MRGVQSKQAFSVKSLILHIWVMCFHLGSIWIYVHNQIQKLQCCELILMFHIDSGFQILKLQYFHFNEFIQKLPMPDADDPHFINVVMSVIHYGTLRHFCWLCIVSLGCWDRCVSMERIFVKKRGWRFSRRSYTVDLTSQAVNTTTV